MPVSASTSLLTDMYELAMFDTTLRAGIAWRTSTFEVFRCRFPTTRRFSVVAGIGHVLGALERFEFEPEQTDWLHEHKVASDDALDYLKDFRFSGDMLGYAEGECYFPGSPLLIVHGTFAECTMLETLLLSVPSYDYAIASAASRVTIVVHGRSCMDMGACRGHERTAVPAARVAIIGGFVGISDLEALKRYGLRVTGTATHPFTLLHDSEHEAFDAQIALLGPDTTLLVDIYDVEQGVINAVETVHAARGKLGTVRLDLGDLVTPAFKVRDQLDAPGATSTKITVADDFDEYAIAILSAVPINSYGVGTKLATGLGVLTAVLVYKLVQRGDASGAQIPVAKRSELKSTVGGHRSAGRILGEDGYAAEEVLVVIDSEKAVKEEFARIGARPLRIPLIIGDGIHSELRGPDALEKARVRHVRSRNGLLYQAWRFFEEDAAIPIRCITL